MPESKGLTISGKNLATWITIFIIVVSSIVDSALTRAQVGQNTKKLEDNPPEVIVTNQKNMAEDIREIKDDIKDLAKAINDYFLNH